MSTIALYSKIELLPEHLKQQVLDYIEFLLSREVKRQPAAQPVAQPVQTEAKPAEAQKPPLRAGFGGAKGMFVMSPDFDEPLEDFKEYM